MEFGLVTTNFKSKISHSELGIFEKATFGISLQYEDYAVTGASTPNSNRLSMGAFILEEKKTLFFQSLAEIPHSYKKLKKPSRF